MKKILKRFELLLMCCAALLLGGCGEEGVQPESKTVELSTEQTEGNIGEAKEPEYIDGFEVAEYEKFNSYASENGLGGTLICIEGKVLNQTKIEDDSEIPILPLIVEQKDGNRWCVVVPSDLELVGVTDKNVRIFGTYQGFSDVMNVPALTVVIEDEKLMDKARIEVEENGNWVEAWNFYNDYAKAEIDKLENIDNGKEYNFGSEKINEIYLEEAPDSEENILKSIIVENEKLENGNIIVFVTNENSYTIPDLELQAIFYKNGEIIETDKDGHDVLVPGNTVVSKMDAPSDYDDYEIKVNVDWKYATSYRNWIYNINVNSNIGDKNIIISFENAGNIDIDELEYIIVFYNGDIATDTSRAKDVRDIKSGDTIIEKVSTYGVEFDGYEIYINQAHTFFNSEGEKIKDTIPENIGKEYRYLKDKKENNIAGTKEDKTQKESENKATTGEKNALKSAKNYLSFMAFSYEGLIAQLEYEQYSHEESIYAADNCGADWNEQALKSAKNYLSFTAFSYTGLIQQLEFEKFTTEQATYGADNCGADWSEQAAKSAKNYLDIMSFSKEGLIKQLEFEGFTHEQAVYGVEQNGY